MAITGRNYNIKEKESLAIGLQALGKVNKYLFRPMKDSMLEDNPELEAYLLTPFSSEKEANESAKLFEKKLYTAIVSSRGKLTPIGVAEAHANAAIEELRYARILTQYETEGLSAKQYNRLIRDNYIATTITKVKRIKRFATRKGVKYTTGTILLLCGAPYAGTVVTAGKFVWDILPQRYKKKIKDTANNVIEYTKETVRSGLKILNEAGETIVDTVCEKMTTAVETVVETGREVVRNVKKGIDACLEIVDSVPTLKKIKDKGIELWKKIKRGW